MPIRTAFYFDASPDDDVELDGVCLPLPVGMTVDLKPAPDGTIGRMAEVKRVSLRLDGDDATLALHCSEPRPVTNPGEN